MSCCERTHQNRLSSARASSPLQRRRFAGYRESLRAAGADAWLRALCLVLIVAVCSTATPAVAETVAPSATQPLLVLGLPVDFILFALTLLGVAFFHHKTLQAAWTGLAAIVVYKRNPNPPHKKRVALPIHSIHTTLGDA